MDKALTINDPLQLPCGAVLPNRLCKAAMTEGLADSMNRSTPELDRLYRIWSEGGAGLLLTGNVQVDRRYLERPGNMVIDNNGGEEALRRLVKAGTSAGNHLWMQLNHTGRQVQRKINPNPGAPSAVPLTSAGDFGSPRALLESEVLDIIKRFAHVASVARETGFNGVEIHAAHGYLLSQFLSPRVNHRTDDWGGSLANRARLLLEVVRAVRKAVGDDFPIGVKLNSADFQKDGFTMDESVQVARWLDVEKIDLLELSGGNYERASMGGIDTPESTLRREGHFLDFAHGLRPAIDVPVMVTGGFRTSKAMNAALQSGDTDVIGMASAFCVEPDLARKLLSGAAEEVWLTPMRQMEAYRGLQEAIEKFSPTQLGAYSMVQIFKIARDGAPQQDLLYVDVVDDFVATEQAAIDRLEDFHPKG